MRSITGRKVCAKSRAACTRSPAASAEGLERLGYGIAHWDFFDTLRVELGQRSSAEVLRRGSSARIAICACSARTRVGISLDETTTPDDVEMLLGLFGENRARPSPARRADRSQIDASKTRTSDFLTHPVFNTHHTETEMLRYLRRLESRDLSLCHSMIPLGSCTMKLNATAEMFPVSWPEFSRMHPFAPNDQTAGYREMCEQLESWLAEITGFAAVSLQPNAGSQGEYAGLLAIRGYHASRGEGASQDLSHPDFRARHQSGERGHGRLQSRPGEMPRRWRHRPRRSPRESRRARDDLAALMVTYPSTHGVFETTIREICEIVHEHGGQVYMDGANMNAQVGLCRPGDIGADVCHLNLHKTFCIPHGGGGPGVGPDRRRGASREISSSLPTLNQQR